MNCKFHPNRHAKARELCVLCWDRAYRAGTLHLHETMQWGKAARWLSNFLQDRHTTEGCILWPFTKSAMGYPIILKNGRQVSVHRQVLEHQLRKPLGGLEACHKCDIPSCINPNHLFPGTRAANAEDCAMKDRKSTKLSNDDVRSIRASDESPGKLAKVFGVTPNTIYRIKHRLRRQHVPDEIICNEIPNLS